MQTTEDCLKSIVTSQRTSGLSLHAFYVALSRIASNPALLRAALQQSGHTDEVPDPVNAQLPL